MDIFALIAERRIQEAIDRGDFDRLALKGQPLPPEDLTAVPEEMRMAYRILKNAGFIPEEIQLRKDILDLRSLLDHCREEERDHLRRQLRNKQLHYDLLMEKNARQSALARHGGGRGRPEVS